MADQVFKNHTYDINTLELFRDLLKFFKKEATYNPPMGKKEYLTSIRSAAVLHARNQGFQNDYIEIVKKTCVFY